MEAMKGIMSLQDITKTLQEHLSEEIEDSKHYWHMAKSAEDMGNDKLAKYLYAISKDEFTHADFIHDYLKESGLMIPEAQAVAFEELKHKIGKMFH